MARYEEEQLALAAQWSQPNRVSIAAMCRDRSIALASHDDATHDHVRESHQLGSVIAEFPTTFEAAEASRAHGMNVLMGHRILCAAARIPATWRQANSPRSVCWISSLPTTTPPACWTPPSVSRMTTATASRCRRRFAGNEEPGIGA